MIGVEWNHLEGALALPPGSEVTYCDPGEWEVCVGSGGDQWRMRLVVRVPGGVLASIEVRARTWPAELAPGEVRALAGEGARRG